MNATGTKVIGIGIDIGGSGVKGAPVDTEAGAFAHERTRVDTPQPSTVDALVATVAEVAAAVQADTPSANGPLGITFPGVVTNGIVRTAANLHKSWIGANAATLFTKAIGRTVHVINDADAAGVAEMAFGAGRGVPGTVLMLTFGTGIGSALFHDGALVPNTEFGHIELRGKDAELRASAKARSDHDMSWGKWSHRVEDYLEHIERLLSPRLIIIGGGVSRHPDKFFPKLRTHAELKPAELANDAGIIGAVSAALANPNV
jgi:polyphosphate glucokinase